MNATDTALVTTELDEMFEDFSDVPKIKELRTQIEDFITSRLQFIGAEPEPQNPQ